MFTIIRGRVVVKNRRHHNNTGYRQIKRGKTREQVKRIAKKLGIKYGFEVDMRTLPLPENADKYKDLD